MLKLLLRSFKPGTQVVLPAHGDAAPVVVRGFLNAGQQRGLLLINPLSTVQLLDVAVAGATPPVFHFKLQPFDVVVFHVA